MSSSFTHRSIGGGSSPACQLPIASLLCLYIASPIQTSHRAAGPWTLSSVPLSQEAAACAPTPPNFSRSYFLLSPTLAWRCCPKTHLPRPPSRHVSLRRFGGNSGNSALSQASPPRRASVSLRFPSTIFQPRSPPLLPVASFVYENKPRLLGDLGCSAVLCFGEGGGKFRVPRVPETAGSF